MRKCYRARLAVWRSRYESALGQRGDLEVDENRMLRVSIRAPSCWDSRFIGSFRTSGILPLDSHALAAGEFATLLARSASRDLCDAHQLFAACKLERKRLRVAFVVYGAINRKDWRTVTVDDVTATPAEVRSQLIPTLRRDALARVEPADAWVARLVTGCREGLAALLPLSDAERGFLDCLLDHGEVNPALLTNDAELADRIRRHPGLEWRAQNVRQFKGDKH